jgi:hypothetical protein
MLGGEGIGVARKNVGQLAVGQIVHAHDPEESEACQKRMWHIVAFPSRRLAQLKSVDGGCDALVDLFALRPVEDA